MKAAEQEALAMLRDAARLRGAAAAFAYPDAARRKAVASSLAALATDAQARRGADDAGSPAPVTARGATPGGMDGGVRGGAQPGRAVDDAIAAAALAWARAGDELEGEYVRLFLGAAPCSLHESSWGDGRRAAGRPVELADVAGFYAAFGFTRSESFPDLPDHLATELEFAAALRIKEAWALAEGLDEAREVTNAALVSFVADHLGRWPRALWAAVVEASAPAPFVAAVHLAAALVEGLCAALGVEPVLADGRVPDEEPERIDCPLEAAPPAP